MKTLKTFLAFLAISLFIVSCTPQELVTNNTNNIDQETYGTGDGDNASTDDDRDGEGEGEDEG